MNQSRILESEAIDEYMSEAFYSFFYDYFDNYKNYYDNFDSYELELNLPLTVYFFKRDFKNLLLIKNTYSHSIFEDVGSSFSYKNRKRISFISKIFGSSIGSYFSKKLKFTVTHNSIKNQWLLDALHYITVTELFKITLAKTLEYALSPTFKYSQFSLGLTIRSFFFSYLNRESLKRRKINFRRKQK